VSNDHEWGLVFAVGVPVVGLIGWIFWVLAVEPAIRKCQFRWVFGHWPTDNPHLKPLMQRQVVEVILSVLAHDLYEHNREEARLLTAMKKGHVGLTEAKSKLARARGNAKVYYRRFKRARKVAEFFEFETKVYKEYIGVTSEEPPEEPHSLQ
jgi:hypothetical protein